MLPAAELPLGCVVAVARLVRCLPAAELRDDQSVLELACGDWSAASTLGRWVAG